MANLSRGTSTIRKEDRSSRLECDSKSDQINDCKIGSYSFPTSCPALKGQCGPVENKPASLFAVLLRKALSRIPPSWCGRQMA